MSGFTKDPTWDKEDPIAVPPSQPLAPVHFWSGPGKIGPSRHQIAPIELTPEQQEIQKANAAARWAAFEEKVNERTKQNEENKLARKEKRKDLVRKIFGKNNAGKERSESIRGLIDGPSVHSRDG